MLKEFVSTCLEEIFELTKAIGFPSYAVAIIVIAVIIRVALMPLNINQMRSSIAMQQIQPMLREIRERYADKPEVMNQKVMQLYQDYNINPLAGCLPMLIQLPIMIGLYNGLRAFIPAEPEFYSFFWIKDLSQVDGTYIMVVLVALSTFLQSYIITGKPTEPMQKYMVIAMPLMMAWMATTFPAFLCVYWLAVTVVGIIQQLIINKPMKAKLEKRAAELAEEQRQKIEEREKQRSKSNQKAREHKAKAPQVENAAASHPAMGHKNRRRKR